MPTPASTISHVPVATLPIIDHQNSVVTSQSQPVVDSMPMGTVPSQSSLTDMDIPLNSGNPVVDCAQSSPTSQAQPLLTGMLRLMTSSVVPYTPIGQTLPLPSDSVPLDLTPMSKFLAQTNIVDKGSNSSEMLPVPHDPSMTFNQSHPANSYTLTPNSLHPINYPASNPFPFTNRNLFSFPDMDINMAHVVYGHPTPTFTAGIATPVRVFNHLL